MLGCSYFGLSSFVGVCALTRVGVVADDGSVAVWARDFGQGSTFGWRNDVMRLVGGILAIAYCASQVVVYVAVVLDFFSNNTRGANLHPTRQHKMAGGAGSDFFAFL